MSAKKILMVAAENGAFAGGKVGGMGDVIRDVPLALAAAGHKVDVVMPGYQHFSRLPGASLTSEITVSFRGRKETLGLYRLPSPTAQNGVRYWAIDHPALAPQGAGKVYCDDGYGQPFATDSGKFALFGIGAAQLIIDGTIDTYDAIHLHDWHTGLVPVLAHYHPNYAALKKMRLVFTIHNLSLQGIRPWRGGDASLESWFPELKYSTEYIADPRFPECFNPMRAAINLSAKVHTVSPNYTQEVQRPSQPEHGFHGGEGLEADLQRAASEGRLVGILNGCEYPDFAPEPMQLDAFLDFARSQVMSWLGRQANAGSIEIIALERLRDWREQVATNPPATIVTSVGRLTGQKVQLLRETMEDGRPALHHVLDTLGAQRAALILLGSGDPGFEQFFCEAAASYKNLLFLRGFSEALSGAIYQLGELFLMPSSFEPCGISQMLAMRAGQPCLVHGVGGLADTVEDKRTGFVFYGDSPRAQAKAMVATLEQALHMKQAYPRKWSALAKCAAAKRFSWASVAADYAEKLYS